MLAPAAATVTILCDDDCACNIFTYMAYSADKCAWAWLGGGCGTGVGQVVGAISWIVDSLLYEEAIAEAEEEQRIRERGATPEQREQDREDGVDDQVRDSVFFFVMCSFFLSYF